MCCALGQTAFRTMLKSLLHLARALPWFHGLFITSNSGWSYVASCESYNLLCLFMSSTMSVIRPSYHFFLSLLPAFSACPHHQYILADLLGRLYQSSSYSWLVTFEADNDVAQTHLLSDGVMEQTIVCCCYRYSWCSLQRAVNVWAFTLKWVVEKEIPQSAKVGVRKMLKWASGFDTGIPCNSHTWMHIPGPGSADHQYSS